MTEGAGFETKDAQRRIEEIVNCERWRKVWQDLFDTHTLIHNRRGTRKIEVSSEDDGAFAVVDIDTLWRDGEGKDDHWKGRVCKVYTKMPGR
jgi:ketosteroid isomerase-like protein